MIGDGPIQKAVNFLRHLVQVVVSVFCLATLLFFVFRLIPSDPIQLLLERTSPPFTARSMERVRSQPLRDHLGLNQSLDHQLMRYYKQILTGEMGTSIWTGQSVGQLIQQQLGISLGLAALSFFCFVVFGTGWGFLQALLSNTPFAFFLGFLNTLAFCTPAFVLASLLFRFSPPIPAELLATLVYTIVTFPTLSSLIRDRLLKEEAQTYAQAAKARGLSRSLLFRRHLLKPCLPLLLSLLPWWWSVYMGASFVIEPLFRISGIGLLALQSFRNLDVPVLLGISFYVGLGRLVLGLVRDCLFAFLFPTRRGGAL